MKTNIAPNIISKITTLKKYFFSCLFACSGGLTFSQVTQNFSVSSTDTVELIKFGITAVVSIFTTYFYHKFKK